MIRGFINSVVQSKYNEANKYIELISQYRRKVGKRIIPSQSKIDNEILFNKIGIFSKLTIAYMVIGLLLFIISFPDSSNNSFAISTI